LKKKEEPIYIVRRNIFKKTVRKTHKKKGIAGKKKKSTKQKRGRVI